MSYSPRPRRARRRLGCLGTTLLLAALFVGVFLIATQYVENAKSAQSNSVGAETAEEGAAFGRADTAIVERIVDGDTLIVAISGASERVRLLNIDAPESVDPNRPVECLGPEASAFLAKLLPVGTTVTLEYDRERLDQYERVLAAVFTPDGALINASIARAGLADSVVFGSNDRFLAEVESAVDAARADELGLWNRGLSCAG